jgi:hypothetical protein
MRWCRARTCADRLNIPPGCRCVGQAEWPTTRDPAQRGLEAGRGPVCVCVRAMAWTAFPRCDWIPGGAHAAGSHLLRHPGW